MGASFSQSLIFMEKNSWGKANMERVQTFIYAMEGEGAIDLDGQLHHLSKGHFVYVPPKYPYKISSDQGMKLTLFQKTYQPLPGYQPPTPLIGETAAVSSELYMDDSQLHMQILLPDEMSYDMAVNIFTYDPGGNLPFVETHVMEHGLVYLQGQGIYRLDQHWFPVMKDDCIWMAPYCPQWFTAMGKEPAVYLYYKNVNRLPIT